MAEQFAPPPINPVISIRPVTVSSPNRDATNVQTQLAALPPGTVIEGFVINRDANNNPILRTSIGDLQMQSDVFVKTGSEMVIRVDATSDSRARIVTINGVTPQDYAAQSTRAVSQDTIMPSQLLSRAPGAAPGTAPQATQPVLQGMLLSAAPQASGGVAPHPLLANLPPALIPASLLRLQAGAALKITMMELQLPPAPIPAFPAAAGAAPASRQALANMPQPLQANPPTPQHQPLQQTAMASTQAAKAAMQPPAGAPHTPAAAPGMPLAAAANAQSQAPRAAANMPTSSHSAQTAASTTAAPNTLPGVVIGHEADGGNVVQTHVGTLKIFTPSPLPVQTRLDLHIEPETAKPGGQPGMPPTAPPAENSDELSSLSRDWPQLSETLSKLTTEDPQIAREMMGAMPQVGHKLASGMMFFLAAVKGGELKQWLGGRNVAALEQKIPGLASKLKGDMAQLQQLFMHSPLDQWSGVMIPMLHDGQLEYARMYLRNEQEGSGQQEGGKKGKEQRFIVEVDMSHLGEIQFDGFVRQGAAKKQFDLIIRTARAFPDEMANEIRGLFDQAMGATGYNGYLAFQQGSQHFVRPLAKDQNSTPPSDHTILA